jgi:hypothetical protein
MKKLFFSLTALALTTVLFAQKKADAVAKFKTETIDMGKLQVSNPSTAVFTVTNIGTEPLIIDQATPTCGCTIGDYTKAPIAPGKTGEIKATYNAANVGAFEKHMTVKFAGVDEVKSITLKGEVLTAEDYAKFKKDGGTNAAALSSEVNVAKVKPAAKPAAKPAKAKSVQ